MRYKGEQAIGLIETIGMVPALLAADAMHLPQCQSPLLRHAHTHWTSPFVRNRYVHEPHSAEWSTFGQEDSRDLRFCETFCPKLLRSRILNRRLERYRTTGFQPTGVLPSCLSENATLGDYGLASGAFSDTFGCARPCVLVPPMLAQPAHAYLCRPPVGCPARQIGS